MNFKKLMEAQNKITYMEKAVTLCETSVPELSQAATRFLDMLYYKNDIDQETYYNNMDRISILANKYKLECSCTKIPKSK